MQIFKIERLPKLIYIYEKITDLVNQDKNIQDSIDALSKSIDTKLSNMTTTINNYRDPCSGTCNWSCQTGCKNGCLGGCGGCMYK